MHMFFRRSIAMYEVKKEEIDEDEWMNEGATTTTTTHFVERDAQLEHLEEREKALDSRESALRDAERKLRERAEQLDEREKALNDERNSFHKEQMLAWEEMRSEQEHIDVLWAKWANRGGAEGRESPTAAHPKEEEQRSPTLFFTEEWHKSPTTARLEERTMEDPESDRELFHNPVYDK